MIDSAEQNRLTRYLLGLLPDGESERLDELSVSSDDFAAELNAVENDLVDAYARGELPDEFAARFKDVYSSSERRRQKLMLAEVFVSYLRKAKGVSKEVPALAERETIRRRRWTWSVPQWGFAAAVAVLLLVSGYFGIANHSLRQRLEQSEVARTELEKKQGEVQRTSPQNATETNQIQSEHLRIASFILLPPLRGSGPLPRVNVPADTDLVVFQLELEAAEFSTYQVTLEDAGDRKAVWNSGDLKPLSEQNSHAISFALKPSLLQSKNYVLELKGVGKNGQAELISAYPFKSIVN